MDVIKIDKKFIILCIIAVVVVQYFYLQGGVGQGQQQQPQNHSIAANTYSIPAAESVSIPFTIPSGVTNAYVSGTVLITGGLFSDISFSIVNTDTGATVMTQTYSGQGNIGNLSTPGSYSIVLRNGALLASEIHTVTLTLNALWLVCTNLITRFFIGTPFTFLN